MDAIGKSDFNLRLYTFLSHFVYFHEGPFPPPEVAMAAAIQLLVDAGVMTKVEIKKRALQEQLIIIPDAYFGKEG